MTVDFMAWSIGLVIFVILVTLTIIYAYRCNSIKNRYIITPEENKKFMEDTIAIQPSNKPIFSDKKSDEVIEIGFMEMKNENYRMMKGVDKDGL